MSSTEMNAMPHIRVQASGQLMALLTFAFTSNPYGIDGLLWGRTRLQRTQQIMDDSTLCREHLDIVVTGFSRPTNWYSTTGEVDEAVLKAEQQQHHPTDTLLGYFCCRKRRSLTPSIREASIHAHLQRFVASTDGGASAAAEADAYRLNPLDYTLLGLWTMSMDESDGTWDWQYCMYKRGRREREFQRVALGVTNLVQSISTVASEDAGDEYLGHSRELSKAIAGFESATIVNQFHQVFRAGYLELKALEQELKEKEQRVAQLLATLDQS
ncbi:hypothetical protein RI367_002346 [Sorochytrium milnesiophthora]